MNRERWRIMRWSMETAEGVDTMQKALLGARASRPLLRRSPEGHRTEQRARRRRSQAFLHTRWPFGQAYGTALPGGYGYAKTNLKRYTVDYTIFTRQIASFRGTSLKNEPKTVNQLILLVITIENSLKRGSKTNLNEPKTGAQRVEQAF